MEFVKVICQQCNESGEFNLEYGMCKSCSRVYCSKCKDNVVRFVRFTLDGVKQCRYCTPHKALRDIDGLTVLHYLRSDCNLYRYQSSFANVIYRVKRKMGLKNLHCVKCQVPLNFTNLVSTPSDNLIFQYNDCNNLCRFCYNN